MTIQKGENLELATFSMIIHRMNFLKIKITILTCFKDIIGYGMKSIFFQHVFRNFPFLRKKLPFLHALTTIVQIYLNIVGSSLLQEPVFLQNILSAVIIPCFGYI